MGERGNAAVVREIFDAFARKEGFALRGLFAEDAVWSVPGRGVMVSAVRSAHEGRVHRLRFASVSIGRGMELARSPRQFGRTIAPGLGKVNCNRGRRMAECRC